MGRALKFSLFGLVLLLRISLVGAEELATRVPPGFVAAPGTVAEPYTNTSWAKEIVYEKMRFEMVFVPAGEFAMGSPVSEPGRYSDEGPAHMVRIAKPFYMGKTEVTQAQWTAVTGKNPSKFRGPNRPVEQISCDDCQRFLDALNEIVPGKGFRLPTEAEWEYACRAGTSTRYGFGDDERELIDYAWYGRNSGHETHDVASKKPNAWGLYDMHGNVWEWCKDWYGKYPLPAGKVLEDPTGLGRGAARVLRGGSWTVEARHCRSAARNRNLPACWFGLYGFRFIRELE